MSSQPASQPDSIDLAYDMWAGQFEFVGPTTNAASINQKQNTLNNNNNNNSSSNHNNNNNNCVKFGSERNTSQKLSAADSLEDLNLNFNTSSTQNPLCNAYSLGVTGGPYSAFGDKQPILIDQETFLSLNPADFEDIVPSDSEPNSLVFIENKLENNNNSLESNNNNNNNNNKIYNLETLTSKFNNKTNNTNTNGFKLENLKNFKNKLLCDFEENGGSGNGNGGSANGTNNNKMNGALSAEICDNLNEQLELLQRKVDDLSDTQNIAEDRTTRTKTEYAVLQARYHMLEEQYRESELRAEERLAEEQKRHREILARVEREASLQNENCQMKIKATEIEANALRDEAQRLRVLCDKQANDLHRTEEQLELARDQIAALQQEYDEQLQTLRRHEQEKKSTEELMLELSHELQRAREENGARAMPTTSPESIRLEELHQELEEMRQKNRSLEEQNEELQATMLTNQATMLTNGVEQGRHLLSGTLNNLAQELEEMSQAQDSVDSATLASLSQLQQAFQEKEDENVRLKHYIDTILLNIVENYPQLLEVKPIERK
ncbi:rab11 family-interacting protein 4B isoform X1 [Drosophila nasuta]|uniref:rab11 family-interacting protein 4B isoform X1 n=1 Tax=Drosophila nasuta TaxID=42062 RepID=UPI00295E97C1|nr:rab11 family-interacting protein 4B isoform X1 [Drosophila nasuta]XP_060655223.1 rab11 family-interacting protein 4B isoform X1 [Drosophila nasuta]